MSPRLASLFALLFLLSGAVAGCGGAVEDGQLEAPESELTEEQRQEVMMDSSAAAKYAD
ncbi:hypothetical protein [Alienimonas californiensis]|uniref:Secreted protein n=1 Tax=Alienimonas californiensis TaxID=2527989 RepID=A0A517P734_9PLAN|nr:hypothetical protein [Alienimonas californiensis]QDT15180.1 hypothetical protein CA12_12610 [Alienimonas californiensis]